MSTLKDARLGHAANMQICDVLLIAAEVPPCKYSSTEIPQLTSHLFDHRFSVQSDPSVVLLNFAPGHKAARTSHEDSSPISWRLLQNETWWVQAD